MKKFTSILMAAVFMFSAGASLAATTSIADYQAKRDAAIKKQDAKLNELQKKKEADKAALKKKQQQRKDAVKNLKESFK